MCLIDAPQFVECALGAQGCPVDTVLPRLYLLLGVNAVVVFHAVGTKWFEALEVDTNVGDLLSRVLLALQP